MSFMYMVIPLLNFVDKLELSCKNQQHITMQNINKFINQIQWKNIKIKDYSLLHLQSYYIKRLKSFLIFYRVIYIS
jgi:hypothetical protein